MDQIEENVQCLNEGEQALAETPQENKEIALPPKFKDTNALLQAYNSLQAEFTRRSQRLKQLEIQLSTTNAPATDAPAAQAQAEESEKAEGLQSTNGDGVQEEVKRKIIAEYLDKVKQSAIPVTTGGIGVSTPAANPRSISEAGNLALQYFKVR